MDDRELITTPAAALYFELSEVHLRRLAAAGKVEAYRRGRQWYFPKDKSILFKPNQAIRERQANGGDQTADGSGQL